MQDVFPPTPFTLPEPSGRRFSRSAALVFSFFSAELYRDVARRWRGIGLTYLILLLTISWIPFAVTAQIGLSAFVKHLAPTALEGFPGITLTKGVVSIDRPEPYLWKDTQTGEVLLYVDTSNKFDLPEGAHAKARLGRNFLETQQDQYTSRKNDLSQLPDYHVDKVWILNVLTRVSSWIGIGIIAGGLIISTIWHLIQILVYGALGLLLCSIFGARLDYAALLRLSAVALTPALLLSAILWVVDVNVPFLWLIYLVIEIGYLAFAVKANATPVQPPVQGFPMSFPPPPPLA